MRYAPAPTMIDPEPLVEALSEARERTLGLVEGISDADLERVHSPLMSPLAWDLGHIAAFEDLWLVHRFAQEPMERADLAEVYDAFETPRPRRGSLPFLRAKEARAYLARVRERALSATARHGAGDGLLHELVVRHERQHCETMLQTLNLARLDGHRPARAQTPPASAAGGPQMVEVPGGEFELGAGDGGFAYDNERPRNPVEVPTFEIGHLPIDNATFLAFVEGGGYQRRELWSEEAWRWKEQYDITHPLNWTDDGREWRIGGYEPIDPDKPVVHVSWFEADAFARAHGARLPTEAEWERAATWDQRTAEKLRFPWGEEPPGPSHANLDQLAFGPAQVGAYPDGASPSGCLGMLGDVWEWTSSHFTAYPGFAAHPYREYSEVFFGDGYRVLRGGSWATARRVATPTFRNWDLPQRRQIFAGLRIARDA
ncbi:MAG: ergothioneine biosynthesis protein EgtB [Solirubrobacteraceae bacterium]